MFLGSPELFAELSSFLGGVLCLVALVLVSKPADIKAGTVAVVAKQLLSLLDGLCGYDGINDSKPSRAREGCERRFGYAANWGY